MNAPNTALLIKSTDINQKEAKRTHILKNNLFGYSGSDEEICKSDEKSSI